MVHFQRQIPYKNSLKRYSLLKVSDILVLDSFPDGPYLYYDDP
jgi:hypothetical protein